MEAGGIELGIEIKDCQRQSLFLTEYIEGIEKICVEGIGTLQLKFDLFSCKYQL